MTEYICINVLYKGKHRRSNTHRQTVHLDLTFYRPRPTEAYRPCVYVRNVGHYYSTGVLVADLVSTSCVYVLWRTNCQNVCIIIDRHKSKSKYTTSSKKKPRLVATYIKCKCNSLRVFGLGAPKPTSMEQVGLNMGRGPHGNVWRSAFCILQVACNDWQSNTQRQTVHWTWTVTRPSVSSLNIIHNGWRNAFCIFTGSLQSLTV